MEKIAIIGAGNLGIAIANGIVEKGLRAAEQVILTRRATKYLSQQKSTGFEVSSDNLEAVSHATTVVLCVQPQQLDQLLEEIKPNLTERHVLVSVITGVSIERIKLSVGPEIKTIRAMPNTAVAIGESMTCIAADDNHDPALELVQRIFNTLGLTLVIDESLMQAATVLGASGVAFFMRYLRAATQGGIQMGFHPEQAQLIAVQTAKGAAKLILENGQHPEVEIDRVTTPKGCTIEGLNEMEHQGFSSALIKGLTTSFNKIRDLSN